MHTQVICQLQTEALGSFLPWGRNSFWARVTLPGRGERRAWCSAGPRRKLALQSLPQTLQSHVFFNSKPFFPTTSCKKLKSGIYMAASQPCWVLVVRNQGLAL